MRKVAKGDRVEMVGVMNDPDPLPVGLKGTVDEAFPNLNQIWVDWDEDDEGRTRSLILLFTDPFRVLSQNEET